MIFINIYFNFVAGFGTLNRLIGSEQGESSNQKNTHEGILSNVEDDDVIHSKNSSQLSLSSVVGLSSQPFSSENQTQDNYLSNKSGTTNLIELQYNEQDNDDDDEGDEDHMIGASTHSTSNLI